MGNIKSMSTSVKKSLGKQIQFEFCNIFVTFGLKLLVYVAGGKYIAVPTRKIYAVLLKMENVTNNNCVLSQGVSISRSRYLNQSTFSHKSAAKTLQVLVRINDLLSHYT